MGDAQGKDNRETFRCIKNILQRKQFHFPGGSEHHCQCHAMPKKTPKHKPATSGCPPRTQSYEYINYVSGLHQAHPGGKNSCKLLRIVLKLDA